MLRLADVADVGASSMKISPGCVAGLATALLLVVGCAVNDQPSVPGTISPRSLASQPVAGPSPSSIPITLRPYQLRLVDSFGSPAPTRTIAAATDCAFLGTDWLRSYCGLTLRSDWRTIIGPTDPFVEPADGTDSVTWLAALSRAQIEGDTTICLDAAARFWMSAGSINQAAPQPGATYVPIRPVAACIGDFHNVATKGSFAGPADGLQTIELLIDPGALARIDGGPAASFDPIVACGGAMRRDLCNEVFDAVAAVLGSRQSQVGSLLAQAEPISCLTASSPCPPPSAGTWAGGARVDIDKTEHYFDVVDIDGQATATEVAGP
jgi:hypothetical protein